MSSAPDAAPKDPAGYRPGPRPGWWALAGYGLLCALLGAGLATVAPRVFGGRPISLPALETPAVAPAPVAPTPAAALTTPAVDPAEPGLGQLSERIAALETRERAASEAAAAALAAAALVEATQQAGPFGPELAAVRQAAPPSPELAALAQVAETGAPTLAALAEGYPDYAARAASAARAPGEGSGLGDRIAYVLARIVTIRRVAQAPGDGVDAVLARAERQVEDGDLTRALATLERLPPAAREAMAPWRMRAERRAAIDHAAASLRARALADLARRSAP